MALLACYCLSGQAQRPTDKLDRGLVAVPAGSGNFVSWRIFGEEYYDTEYNLYRNGTKLNDTPLKVSNYSDTGGNATSKYQVAAVVRGVEQEKSAEVTRWGAQYKQFAVGKLYSRRGTDITSKYDINDIALADLDGDGVSEFILKRNYTPDKMSINNDSAYNVLDVYNLKGERLWYIDLGPNMVSGPDEQYDAVGYDWDGDGRAEVLMRGADNMIIHHPDGSTTKIGNMNTNTRNTVNQSDGNLAYTNYGNEYLLYMEGQTGKLYENTNGKANFTPMAYPLPRGNANDWGDGYGHRSTKHYFGAPFLDGRKAFIFLGRGCYTKHHMKAFSVDPQTHALTLYWEWKGESGAWFGQGYHNYGIADVDWDGRDEIVFGSMVIDDNGKGLHTTGLGHGDAQHCSDFDPYRHGQEIFACNEDHPAMNYRNGTTGKIYYRLQSTSDDGRALCGNFSNNYPGAIGHSSQSGTVSCVADKVISGAPGGFTNNWRIYWDGDLLEEGLDGASSREGAARVFKADGSIVFTADGTANCNWTKNTPSAAGDILGDWREEIIVRTSDNKYVRVYTTNIKTNYRNYTLWHDHQYRQGMVWESMGYNQPPHTSYFLGELENITVAPPPFTMTGRTEVHNGGTIGNSDEHFIVCETNDTEVTIADGASPWVVTFNVPSWVQGTNSAVTNGNAKIERTYYTCTVNGGALAGEARLVKQGDGVLNLPKAAFTNSGNTDIWAGVVNFDGSMLKSPLWLNRFAELNSDGGQFQSISMLYGAKLRPGRADHIGTVTTESLELGMGARIVFDINGSDCDQVKTKTLSIERKTWQYGPQYLTPVFEFNNMADGDPKPGEYLIATAESITGSLSNIRIEGLGTKLKTSLEQRDQNIYLVIAGVRDAGFVTWTGAVSNVWNMADTENFVDGEGQSNFFVTGDYVCFTDSAANFAVNLSGDLEADTVLVDNTKAYNFTGNGRLVGNTTLVKQGSGSLTIKTDNTYTGGNRLSGGVVSVTSLANSTQPKGNLGGVTTAATKFIIENGAELRTTAAVTNGSPIAFMGDEGGVINNSADFIVDRAMSGSVLTKKGNGWMKLNTSNNSLTRLIIQAGTVQCVNTNMPAKTVEFQGGTLSEHAGSSYAIVVAKNKSGTWNLVNDATYSNTITGEGTITISCPVRSGGSGSGKWYATRTKMQLKLANFKGTLKPASNGDPSGRFTLDTNSGMPEGTMNIPAGILVLNTAKSFHIGKLAGSGSLGGISDFGGGASGTNTWQIGCDENFSFAGTITANSIFNKVGTGKVTWSGSNDNTGSTNINEGELALTGNGRLGSGALTVGANGTLSGMNKQTNALINSTVNVKGMLRPGLLPTSTTGTLYFSNRNVSIATTGVIVINAAKCATATAPGCTNLDGIKTLAINGTIRIVPSETNTLKVGDSIRIFNAATVTGTPIFDMQGGIEWDTTRLSEGLLFVKAIDTAVPEIVSLQRPRNIYDMRGRLVRRNATNTEGLPAGIYICEGRKFVVK
jgi:autotransporter-associated beta strand protein